MSQRGAIQLITVEAPRRHQCVHPFAEALVVVALQEVDAAIVARWQEFFADDAAPFSRDPELVVVLENGTLAQTEGPVANPDGTVTARFQSVWRRTPDGEWRVVFDNGHPVCP